MKQKPIKIAMTGATSFIGAALVRELLDRGCELYALVRPGSAAKISIPENQRLHIIDGSLDEVSALPDRIPGGCQVFLHLGWDGSGSVNRTMEELQQRNYEYTMEALRAARKLGCGRFLFTGSQAEYGRHQELMSEDSGCNPITEYGKIKLKTGLAAAGYAREQGIDFVHARIFSVYGSDDHPWTLVMSCLRQFSAGESISLSECNQIWNFLYITDAAKALTALTLCDKMLAEYGSVYNVAGAMDQTKPLRWFVETMYELSGRKGSYAYGRREPNAEGPVNLIPDITKISRITGWQPRTQFEDGIRQMLTH